MRRLNIVVPLLVCGVLMLASVDGLAQETTKPPAKMSIYQLDFALHENEDGRRVNTRNYMLQFEYGRSGRPAPEGFGGSFGRIRSNTKVPVSTDDKQVVYMDVGLNIDCDIREADDYVLTDISMRISNFADPGQAGSGRPLIREISSVVRTALQPKKPTVVAMIDDAATKRRYELEVTVTKVK